MLAITRVVYGCGARSPKSHGGRRDARPGGECRADRIHGIAVAGDPDLPIGIGQARSDLLVDQELDLDASTR